MTKIVVWLGGYKSVFEATEDEEYTWQVMDNSILVIKKNGEIIRVYKEWSSVSVL